MPTFTGEDAFDLLSAADDPYGAKRKAAKAGDFTPAATDPDKGAFREKHIPPGAEGAPALVDGRLSRFLEMGFEVVAAERALAAAGNDVDGALTLLLDQKAKKAEASS